jgi:ribosome biogenesis GTPase
MASNKKNKQKIRADFRKNRVSRARDGDLTRQFQQHGFTEDDSSRSERISGKGELTRKRTVVGSVAAEDGTGLSVHPEVNEQSCLPGRVLSVHGLVCCVAAEDGRKYRCAVRRVLKTLSTEQRHVIAAGDLVQIRTAGPEEGIIERIEPRRGVLCRTSRSRRHVMVANVDQLLIVTSAAEPELKPNLIDRLLVTAETSRIRPIVCINKADLADIAHLQPLIGVYGQLGYQVLVTSTVSELGVDCLRRVLTNCESVLIGQSGVGKSSLLNALEPGLGLRVREVSSENEKGRHTTTAAQLIPLSFGGYVVDTPGIRQFQLWDVIPEEVSGFFRELRPYVSYCRFPDCTHRHESDCAVKNAVADGKVDARRYESYCHLFSGDTM